MKIATYNIASGGFSDYTSRSDKPERLELLQDAIAAIDASVIGLTDTFRWTQAFTPKQIQRVFGYSASVHIDMNDTRVDKRIGIALLSRYPIVASSTVRLHNRNAIKVTINISEEKSLVVFVVYLDDLSEQTRLEQVNALIEHLPSNGPVAVIGDFNALWPLHVPEVKQHVNTFLEAHPDFKTLDSYLALQTTFDNFYQATALPSLEAQGFTEPPEIRPTALTPLHPLGLPCLFPVDHIVVRNCTASSFAAPTGAIFNSASDHYPLTANLDLGT